MITSFSEIYSFIMILVIFNFSFFLCRNCHGVFVITAKEARNACDEVHVNVVEFFWGIHQPSNELPLKKWQHLNRFCYNIKAQSFSVFGGMFTLLFSQHISQQIKYPPITAGRILVCPLCSHKNLIMILWVSRLHHYVFAQIYDFKIEHWSHTTQDMKAIFFVT